MVVSSDFLVIACPTFDFDDGMIDILRMDTLASVNTIYGSTDFMNVGGSFALTGIPGKTGILLYQTLNDTQGSLHELTILIN